MKRQIKKLSLNKKTILNLGKTDMANKLGGDHTNTAHACGCSGGCTYGCTAYGCTLQTCDGHTCNRGHNC